MRRIGAELEAVTASIAGMTVLALTTFGCQKIVAHPGQTGQASPPATVPPLTSPIPSGEAALALWKRTLAAARDTPAQVSVMETRYPTPAALAAGAAPEVMAYVATEGAPPTPRAGQPPHYRLQYVSPTRLAGVILLSDGSAVWRYDPQTRIAGRHGADTAPTPPELEEGIAGVPAQADGARPEIEATAERVAGRLAVVLVLRRVGSGRTLERRWVDVETGRTLRWEQYAGRDAYLARRVEVTKIVYLTTPAQIADANARLRADFPAGTQKIDRRPLHVRRIDEAEAVAGRVHLPLHVRGFSVRGVKHAPTPPPVKSMTVSETAATPTQLFYSNGEQAISVFVTPSTSAASTVPTSAMPASAVTESALRSPGQTVSAHPQDVVRQSAAWHLTPFDGGRIGYTREIGAGAAVAWTAPDGSYVAVSRMPLPRLLPVVAAIAADRDDAPEQRSQQ